MNFLKRDLAPLTDGAWAEIDGEAMQVLKGNLSGRRVVDVAGPSGMELAAVNLGRLKTGKASPVEGVEWGVRQVQPLTEIRVPFSLNIWEMDNLERGCADVDLDAVDDAARKVAIFEETALYQGFDQGCVQGILDVSPHKEIALHKTNAGKITAAVEKAIVTVEKSGIGGPYALVLGTQAYEMLMAGDECGYPLNKRIEGLVSGGIHWSPAVSCGVLVSKRGGDFELTLGQDLAIGYHASTTKRVDLYLTESFTFRALEPAAAVGFKWQG
ncbi:MAG: family 1 encapsulin nanocompartment shell protein [Lentisphaeria bacterium]